MEHNEQEESDETPQHLLERHTAFMAKLPYKVGDTVRHSANFVYGDLPHWDPNAPAYRITAFLPVGGHLEEACAVLQPLVGGAAITAHWHDVSPMPLHPAFEWYVGRGNYKEQRPTGEPIAWSAAAA